jgi:hypothetical protein
MKISAAVITAILRRPSCAFSGHAHNAQSEHKPRQLQFQQVRASECLEMRQKRGAMRIEFRSNEAGDRGFARRLVACPEKYEKRKNETQSKALHTTNVKFPMIHGTTNAKINQGNIFDVGQHTPAAQFEKKRNCEMKLEQAFWQTSMISAALQLESPTNRHVVLSLLKRCMLASA